MYEYLKVGGWVNWKVGEKTVYVWWVDAIGKWRLLTMTEGRKEGMARRKDTSGKAGEMEDVGRRRTS